MAVGQMSSAARRPVSPKRVDFDGSGMWVYGELSLLSGQNTGKIGKFDLKYRRIIILCSIHVGF